MQKFIYKACDKQLNIVKGFIEEDDIDSAKEKLLAKELKIIDIRKSSDILELVHRSKIMKDSEIASFCGQIGTILDSGVSLLRGLEILELQTTNKKQKQVIGDILVGVRRGKSLAKAMEDTRIFPKALTDMVMSGEVSGNVDKVLFNMEEFYEREASIKSKIKSASIYPVILLVVAVGMMIFFNFFIFSELKELFQGMKLPPATAIMFNTINYVNNNYLQIFCFIALIFLLIKYLLEKPKVKYAVHKRSLQLPVIGEVKNHIIIARFTRSMAIFLRSGVPLLTVLENLQLIVDNHFVSKQLAEAKELIVKGEGIATSLESKGIFEPMVVQMLRVGEETGKLEEMLYRLADIYDKKVDTGIKRLVALIEPVFTLVAGIIVGIIIIVVAMPIMQMAQGVK